MNKVSDKNLIDLAKLLIKVRAVGKNWCGQCVIKIGENKTAELDDIADRVLKLSNASGLTKLEKEAALFCEEKLLKFYKAANKCSESPSDSFQPLAVIAKFVFDGTKLEIESRKINKNIFNEDRNDFNIHEDVVININKYMNLIDLLQVRSLSNRCKKIVNIELINRLNHGEISLSDLGFKNIKQIIDFFEQDCSRIESLNLENIVVDDDSINQVYKFFPQVKHLFLCRADVTNKSIQCLREFKFIKSIYLKDCTKLTDLKFLQDYISLESLAIDCTTLVETGKNRSSNVYFDLDFLKNCHTLKKLEINLPKNYGFDGNLLKNCTSLNDLSLSIPVSDYSFLEKLKLLSNLSIKFPLVNGKSEKYCFNFKYLENLQFLRSLEIEGFDKYKNIDALKNASLFNKLVLKHEYVYYFQKNIDWLPKLPHLEHLTISYYDRTDVLEGLNIKSLTIHNTSSNDFSFLENHSSLIKLDLNKTKVKDLSFLKKLPFIEELDLGECSEIDDFTPLKDCKSLTSLKLCFTKIKDISFIKDLPLLKKLDLSGCTKINDFSLQSDSLQWLNFTNINSINECLFLKKCPSLQVLFMNRNFLKDEFLLIGQNSHTFSSLKVHYGHGFDGRGKIIILPRTFRELAALKYQGRNTLKHR